MCRSYTIAINFVSGMTSGNAQTVVWSYTNDLKQTGTFVSNFDSIIQQANAANA